jgi:hypothetical protein
VNFARASPEVSAVSEKRYVQGRGAFASITLFSHKIQGEADAKT